jgi:hypothetical protein
MFSLPKVMIIDYSHPGARLSRFQGFQQREKYTAATSRKQ